MFESFLRVPWEVYGRTHSCACSVGCVCWTWLGILHECSYQRHDFTSNCESGGTCWLLFIEMAEIPSLARPDPLDRKINAFSAQWVMIESWWFTDCFPCVCYPVLASGVCVRACVNTWLVMAQHFLSFPLCTVLTVKSTLLLVMGNVITLVCLSKLQKTMLVFEPHVMKQRPVV